MESRGQVWGLSCGFGGVSLLVIDSVSCPHPLRLELWERLAGDLQPRHLERIA